MFGNAFNVGAGYLQCVKVVPGTGATVPDDDYDLALLDSDGVDVLSAAGADLSNAAGSFLQFDPPLFVAAGTLDVNISNAGNSKTGRVDVFLSR